jgi:hypothetical protein
MAKMAELESDFWRLAAAAAGGPLSLCAAFGAELTEEDYA